MSTRSRLVAVALISALVATLTAGCSDDGGGGASGGAAGDGGEDADGGDGGADPANELRVTLDDGVVEGDPAGETRRFLQIPYAAPPVGELRWEAPEPPEPWDGVRHESDFAEACPQNRSVQGPASTNEDCLYANVWSPSPEPEDAPVMVWIHGGGNFAGSAGDLVPGTEQLWYDGEVFARRHGVVVVTFNYRLGPLGFFPHPALAEGGAPLGNQGLLDQQRLLEWVQDNIARFGGDPGNVTIFGESAGSADVCYHVASPRSRDLFHRAVGQSGGCTTQELPEGDGDDKVASMEAYAAAVGCDGREADDVAACLRDAPIEDLMRQAQQPEPSQGDPLQGTDWSFGAVVDGDDGYLPDQPRRRFDDGDIVDVPYILGSNNDEGTVFVFQLEVTNQAQYEEQVRSRFPDNADAVLERYPASDYGGDHLAALATAVGDAGIICGTTDTARRAAAAGLPVYTYNFDVPWAISPDVLQATHAAEMSHVFGNPLRPDEASAAVGEAMNAYWASFAASGDPNHEGAPANWPRFEPDEEGGDRRLQFAAEIEVVRDFRQDECAFWGENAGT